MATRPPRRHSTPSPAALAAGDLAAFLPLSPATDAETRVTPDIVRFSPDIEPLVRLIERTPIERCPEMLAERLRAGTPYRQLLAALFLAALRGPSSIAHSVFVIHSAHQLALDAPMEERLLPLFWSLNNYKYWHAWHTDNPERLPAFRGTLPPEETAEAEFHVAMAQGDQPRAEAALLCLMRSQGMPRVMELLWAHVAKDCADVGHNAIALTSTWRALPTIGWQHAEPILRWALGRLMSQGDPTYRPNQERVRQTVNRLPAGWAAGSGDAGLTRELLALMRSLEDVEACGLIVARLAAGTGRAGAVWDAIHLHAAEVMMRKPDDGHPLHANTAANSLHYAFRMSADPANRLLILLQAVCWQCQHRRRKRETDPEWRASTLRIDEMEEVPISDRPEEAAREVVTALSVGAGEAGGKAFSFARRHPASDAFQAAARRLVLAKASVNAHDIKFPVAIFEDCGHVSPVWRPHLTAASVFWLPEAARPDSLPVEQAREALKG